MSIYDWLDELEFKSQNPGSVRIKNLLEYRLYSKVYQSLLKIIKNCTLSTHCTYESYTSGHSFHLALPLKFTDQGGVGEGKKHFRDINEQKFLVDTVITKTLHSNFTSDAQLF